MNNSLEYQSCQSRLSIYPHMITVFIVALISFCILNQIAIAQPLGEVDTVGNTWCEWQWGFRSIGDMIVRDTLEGTVYFVWTYGPPPPYEDQHFSYYNYFSLQNGLHCPEPGCELIPDSAIYQYHTVLLRDRTGGLSNLEIGFECVGAAHTMRAWDNGGIFDIMPIDTSWYPFEMEVQRVMGRNGTVHLLGNGQPEIRRTYFCYSSYTLNPFSMCFWELIDTTRTLVYDMAASPVSDRAAICYARQKDFNGSPEIYYDIDTDIYLVTSPNGIDWDWASKTNLTNFGFSDPFRVGCTVEVFFDLNDILHIVFFTRGIHLDYNPYDSTVFDGNLQFFWHWSEDSDTFTVAIDGWIPDPPAGRCEFGVRPVVNHPKMAIDSYSGFLYLVYERYSYDDCTIGVHYPNGEIWATVSTDGGINWSQGVSITNTHTPGCIWGECASELQPSIDALVNDTLHVMYVYDTDAVIRQIEGGGVYEESKIIYQRIPSSLIPTAPLLPQFSISDGPIRCKYKPGDLNGDGNRNGVDVLFAINYFKGLGSAPQIDCDCPAIVRPFYAAGDVNGSCAFNGIDVTFYVNYLKGREPWFRYCPGCPPSNI